MKNLLDAWFKMNIGEGAFYAVLGLVFVIVGIALLLLVLALIGLIMKKWTARREEKKAPPASPPSFEPMSASDEVSPEVVAVIMAALMSYYQTENTACDFVVRRIKRVERSKDHA